MICIKVKIRPAQLTFDQYPHYMRGYRDGQSQRPGLLEKIKRRCEPAPQVWSEKRMYDELMHKKALEGYREVYEGWDSE